MPETNDAKVNWLDSGLKATAALIGIIYATGYLILSIGHSQLGFADNDGLKPQTIAVGLLFLLLTGIPIYTVHNHGVMAQVLSKEFWLVERMTRISAYYCFCVLLATAAGNLLSDPKRWGFVEPHQLLIWLGFGILLLVLYPLLRITNARKPYWLTAGIPLLIVLLGLQLFIFFHLVDPRYALTHWFFCVGVFYAINRRLWVDTKLRKLHNWTFTVFQVLPLIVLYATYVFPKLKPSLGGGAASPITVYFPSTQNPFGLQEVQSTLLDENDTGLYITDPSGTNAVFVPKATISGVYFAGRDKKLRK